MWKNFNEMILNDSSLLEKYGFHQNIRRKEIEHIQNTMFEETLRQELDKQFNTFKNENDNFKVASISFAYMNAVIIKALEKRGEILMDD